MLDFFGKSRFAGGTTGLPKGVPRPRTHNSYLANIRYTNADIGPEDVRGLATPTGHSMAHQGPELEDILNDPNLNQYDLRVRAKITSHFYASPYGGK